MKIYTSLNTLENISFFSLEMFFVGRVCRVIMVSNGIVFHLFDFCELLDIAYFIFLYKVCYTQRKDEKKDEYSTYGKEKEP